MREPLRTKKVCTPLLYKRFFSKISGTFLRAQKKHFTRSHTQRKRNNVRSTTIEKNRASRDRERSRGNCHRVRAFFPLLLLLLLLLRFFFVLSFFLRRDVFGRKPRAFCISRAFSRVENVRKGWNDFLVVRFGGSFCTRVRARLITRASFRAPRRFFLLFFSFSNPSPRVTKLYSQHNK